MCKPGVLHGAVFLFALLLSAVALAQELVLDARPIDQETAETAIAAAACIGCVVGEAVCPAGISIKITTQLHRDFITSALRRMRGLRGLVKARESISVRRSCRANSGAESALSLCNVGFV